MTRRLPAPALQRAPLPLRTVGIVRRRIFDVEGERPVVDVGEVELHPLVEARQVAAPGDLPEAGEPRLHREAAALPLLVAGDLLRERRAGADERHLPLQDVPELRDLVEGEAAEEAAEGGDARVVRRLEDGPVVLVQVRHLGEQPLGAFDHRPELVERERPPVQAAAHLPEEDRAVRGDLDEGRDERGEREADETESGGDADVEDPLGDEAAGLRGGRGERQERRPVELLQLDLREDVREEVEDEPRLDAHLLAQQEDVLERLDVAPVDGEDHLVDGQRGQDRREVLERSEDREASRRRPRLRRRGALPHEAEEPQPPPGVVVDEAGHRAGARRVADEDDRPEVVAAHPDLPRDGCARRAARR